MSLRANDALAESLRKLLACAAALTAGPVPECRPRWWGQARALRYAIENRDPATERRRCERDLLKAAMASIAAQDDKADRNEWRRYLPTVPHD